MLVEAGKNDEAAAEQTAGNFSHAVGGSVFLLCLSFFGRGRKGVVRKQGQRRYSRPENTLKLHVAIIFRSGQFNSKY